MMTFVQFKFLIHHLMSKPPSQKYSKLLIKK